MVELNGEFIKFLMQSLVFVNFLNGKESVSLLSLNEHEK
jgi:hypothetical protein